MIARVPDGEKNNVEEKMSGGNQPKKLKSHYICEIEPNKYDVNEVKQTLIYHHSKKDKLLYTVEAIEAGQLFKGQIITTKELSDTVINLLKNCVLRFGKSKSAQYGACQLIYINCQPHMNMEKDFLEGTSIAVTLRSEGLFPTEKGYTVNFEKVKSQIAESIGLIDDGGEKLYSVEDEESIATTSEILGYNSTWNMKRQAIPCIGSGSVFIYRLDRDVKLSVYPTTFVGGRNLEGYGQVDILDMDSMSYDLTKTNIDSCDNQSAYMKMDGQFSKELVLSIVKKKFSSVILNMYINKNDKFKYNLNASTIGRITLMLKESINLYNDDYRATFNDFVIRICTIKRDKERKEAIRLLKNTIAKEDASDMKDVRYSLSFDAIRNYESHNKEIEDCVNIVKKYEKDAEEFLMECWTEYMLSVLTCMKYAKKEEMQYD